MTPGRTRLLISRMSGGDSRPVPEATRQAYTRTGPGGAERGVFGWFVELDGLAGLLAFTAEHGAVICGPSPHNPRLLQLEIDDWGDPSSSAATAGGTGDGWTGLRP